MTEENGGRKWDKGDGEERGRLAPEGIAAAEWALKPLPPKHDLAIVTAEVSL